MRLFIAAMVAIFAGVTLTACYLISTAPPKPECAFCRCPHEAHEWRFGERGQCQRCRSCAWYAAELP